MSTSPVRGYGTATVLDAPLEIRLSLDLVTDQQDQETLDASDAPYLTLPAGVYSPQGLLLSVGHRVRQWIFDAVDGSPALVNNMASAAEVPFFLGLAGPLARLPLGGNRVRWELNGFLDATLNGEPVVVTSATLLNTNGLWSLLGLCRPDEARTEMALGLDLLRIDGRYQPRWLYVTKASFRDTGDIRQPQEYQAVSFGKKVRTFRFGEDRVTRDITLVDETPEFAGPDVVAGEFGAVQGQRWKVDFPAYDESTLLEVEDTDRQPDLLTPHRYLRVGDFRARLDAVTGDTVVLFEPLPSGEAPPLRSPLELVSEGQALLEEALETGYLFPLELNESTGAPRWTPKAYAPRSQEGSFLLQPRIREQNLPYYSLEVPLLLRTDPELTVV